MARKTPFCKDQPKHALDNCCQLYYDFPDDDDEDDDGDDGIVQELFNI